MNNSWSPTKRISYERVDSNFTLETPLHPSHPEASWRGNFIEDDHELNNLKPGAGGVYSSTRLSHSSTIPLSAGLDSSINKTERSERNHSFFMHESQRNNWWIAEFSSCFAALGILAAISGILWRWDQRPLESWNFPITPNTLVSTLATLVRVFLAYALMQAQSQLKWLWFERSRPLKDFQAFDSASKSPILSLRLFGTIRRPHLAHFGALILLASLAIDPFIQQVIEYPSVPVLQAANASIACSNSYGEFYVGATQAVLAYQESHQNTMAAAAYSALFNPDAGSLQVVPSCITGNCSFPWQYRSLAVCSRCVNITDQIHGPIIQENVTLLAAGVRGIGYVWSLPNTTYPNTTRVSIMDVYQSEGNDYSATGELNLYKDFDIMDIAVTGSGSGTTSFSSVPDGVMFGTITMLSTDNQSGVNSSNGLLRDVWAMECALEYCVQTYVAEVVNGVLNETVLDTFYFTNTSDATAWIESPYNNPFGALMPHQCILEGNVHDLPTGAQPALPTAYGMVGKRDTSAHQQDATSSVPPNCVFIYQEDYSQGALPGILSNFSIGNAMVGNFTQEDFMNRFLGIAQNVSAAMTRAIRTTTSSTNGEDIATTTLAQGLVYRNAVVVKVRWKWIALPATMIVCGVAFIIGTMLQSRGKPLWKGSALPALFHGLEHAPDKEELYEMDNIAAMQRVRLGRDRNNKLGLVAG